MKAGFHGLPQGPQVVFYVMASGGIEVIAIVHPGADVDSHLGAMTTESVPCGPAAGSLLTR